MKLYITDFNEKEEFIIKASFKPSYNTNRMLLGEQLPLDTPLSVILDVSERCNFRCGYCFRSDKKDESWSFAASDALMPWSIFERASAQLLSFPQKIKLVSLSGQGEPLLNPRIADMARHLRRLGIERVDIHTNGSALTETNAAEIGQAGFTRIVVSLQGVNADDYIRVCGYEIDFERFIDNLQRLYKHKNPETHLHVKIMDVALRGDDEERRFYEIFSGVADSLYIEKPVPIWQNVLIANNQDNKFGENVGKVACCQIVFYKLWVSPEGDIYPCTKLPPPPRLGNILKMTLREAWESRQRLEFLKNHLKSTRQAIQTCAACYIPVNTVTSSEDIIDPYKDEILERLERLPQDE